MKRVNAKVSAVLLLAAAAFLFCVPADGSENSKMPFMDIPGPPEAEEPEVPEEPEVTEEPDVMEEPGVPEEPEAPVEPEPVEPEPDEPVRGERGGAWIPAAFLAAVAAFLAAIFLFSRKSRL